MIRVRSEIKRVDPGIVSLEWEWGLKDTGDDKITGCLEKFDKNNNKWQIKKRKLWWLRKCQHLK